MSPRPLTVRNLSSNVLHLKHIEQFEDPNTQQSKATSYFGSRNTTSAVPASPRLGEHAQTFQNKDVDIRLRPFESYTLEFIKWDLHASGNSPSQNVTSTFRLTFEVGSTGERHRIDVNPTYTQKSSRPFIPLSPSPSITLSALYHPASDFPSQTNPQLTIHTNHTQNPKSWMSSLPSTLPLSALSIPGTHNSHTHYRALPSVRCQHASINQQLENGIRFLDIRAQPTSATDANKRDMYLVHGVFPVSLTGPKYLASILETCYRFLEENPSETILVSLKREGPGKATDELFSDILERHYFAPNRGRWYTGHAVPYLGDVRGKLVLIRRYMHHPTTLAPTPHGLDATAWPHNSTHAQHGPFCVQDYCEVMVPSAIPHKLQYSTEHLGRAAACTAFIPGYNTDAKNPVPAGPLYLNFLTGSNFWKKECWPSPIAEVVNRGVEEWICRNLGVQADASGGGGGGTALYKATAGDHGTGIVIMDDIGKGGDWDLVRLVIGCNMGVLLKMKGEI